MEEREKLENVNSALNLRNRSNIKYYRLRGLNQQEIKRMIDRIKFIILYSLSHTILQCHQRHTHINFPFTIFMCYSVCWLFKGNFLL